MITSTANAQVKRWAKLTASAALRHESQSCIIEGATMVREAIGLGLVTTVLLKESTEFECDSIPVERLSEHCFKKISQLNSGSVMAVVTLPTPQLNWSSYQRILICERLQNPDNLGSLIRAAHAAEFDALITTPGSADLFNPKTLRASTGSALRFPCFQLPIDEIFTALKANNITSLGLAADGNYQLFSNKPAGKIALVLGNEGQGLSDEVANLIDHRAALPINPEVESLNAAIAASIAMYQISWG